MKLMVATFNLDKLRELKQLLDMPELELVSLRDVAGASAPAETGQSLLDNARLKARGAHALTGLAAIADDTGLEVDALGGRPGIYTARFAGHNATYDENVRRLLEVLMGHAPEQRRARFRTACVTVLEDGSELHTEGVLEGRITVDRRGTEGFGYDPVFELPELGRTLAELTPAEKNEYSHRARAVRAMAELLALHVSAGGC